MSCFLLKFSELSSLPFCHQPSLAPPDYQLERTTCFVKRGCLEWQPRPASKYILLKLSHFFPSLWCFTRSILASSHVCAFITNYHAVSQDTVATMSGNDLIPALTRASSTSRYYWRQLNQPRMDGPYPVMPAANSSQESSRSGNRSPSSARSRRSPTPKQSLSTTLPGSDLMESLDSGSLRRPQNRGPRDRSVSEGVVVCPFLALACRV